MAAFFFFFSLTTYHQDKDTGARQWHFPTASEAKDPLKAKKRAEWATEREERKRPFAAAVSTTTTTGESQQPAAAAVAAKRSRPTIAATKTTTTTNDDFLELADATSIAVIVPFRDLHEAQKRAEHLKQFVPHMHSVSQHDDDDVWKR